MRVSRSQVPSPPPAVEPIDVPLAVVGPNAVSRVAGQVSGSALGSLPARAQDLMLGALGLGARPRLLGPEAIAAQVARLGRLGVKTEVIGTSREGRPLHALTVGHGPLKLAAISGAHPDEPVGALTCLALAERIQTDPNLAALKDRVTLSMVPDANPDGAARNEPWFAAWSQGGPLAPRLRAYFEHVARDLPRDDVEFGFPPPGTESAGARPENLAIAAWLDRLGPLDHYASLHSMFLGGGALFLVTTDDLPAQSDKLELLRARAAELGLGLHDKDRMGQKGFSRIGPGLQTAPTQAAMKAFFQAAAAAGDATAQAQADAFLLNSMQYAQLVNRSPLAIVSEIPLVYDPRLASMAPAGLSRREEESRFADGLLDVFARVERLLGTHVPEAVARRLETGRAAARAQQLDLARYGDVPATVGNVLENDLNLARREATLLAGALHTLPPEAGDARAQVSRRLDAVLETIARDFDLQTPTLDTQARLQMAAVLAPVFRRDLP